MLDSTGSEGPPGPLTTDLVLQRLSVLGRLPAAGPGHKVHVYPTTGAFELVAPTLTGRMWRWWSGGSAAQTVVAVNDTLCALEATGGVPLTPAIVQRLALAGEGLAHLAATYETTHEPFVRDALHAASRRCFALVGDAGGSGSPDAWRREASALERRAADLELEAFLIGESARLSPSLTPSPPALTPSPPASTPSPPVLTPSPPALTPPPPPPSPEQVHNHAQEAPRQIVMQMPPCPATTRPAVGVFALPSSPVRIVSFATYPRRRDGRRGAACP